jgi:Winged helix DNA-binding domain
VPAVDRTRILAFRQAGHNLIEHLGPHSLVKAAACGIQETPLGSAAVALQARVDGLTPAALDRALLRERTLVHLWSLRGAPYLVPAHDLHVFTAGTLPVDRASFKVFLGGWAPAIEQAGLDPFELFEAMAAAARVLLDRRTLNVNELRDALLGRVDVLSGIRRPKEARHDMPEPLYRAIGLSGAVCMAEGRGTDALLARTDQWLAGRRLGPTLRWPEPSWCGGSCTATGRRRRNGSLNGPREASATPRPHSSSSSTS